jgi:hypothetical protein
LEYNGICSVYAYTVTAVDTASNESVPSYPSIWVYRGISYTIDSQFSYDGVTQTWNDTAGSPVNGPYDVAVNWPSGVGGFLPVMENGGDGHGNQTIFDDLEVGAFNYMVFDIKFATSPLQTNLQLIPQSRAYGNPYPAGGGGVDTTANIQFNINSYGTPVLNQWATFKVPFSVLPWGSCVITGYIVANTSGANYPYGAVLTVLSVVSQTNVGVVSAMRISDAGSLTPANTYILGPTSPPNFGPGTYNITGPNITTSTNIGSSGSPVTFNLFNGTVYKFGFQWGSTVPTQNAYFNNIGFTTT